MGKKRRTNTGQNGGADKKPRIHENPSHKTQDPDSNDWFSTPPVIEMHQLQNADNAAPVPVLSNRQQKKLKRAEQHRQKQLNTAANPPQSNNTPSPIKPEPAASPTIQSVAPSSSISTPHFSPQIAMPLMPKSYTSVDTLIKTDHTFSSSMLYTTAAVVTKITRPEKPSSDPSCSLSIVDPSSWDSESLKARKFTVNCFMKEDTQLPQTKEGDIVILRSLKLWRFNGANQGKGYPDKLRWACYSNGEMVQPTFAPVIDGQVYQYSGEEVEYCRQLAAWWAGVQVLVQESKGTTYDLGAQRTYQPRQHRLLGEVLPDMFFDCTVEVLRKYDRSNNGYPVMCLYVTDYTRLGQQNYAHQAKWIDGVDRDTVLPIELWQDAFQQARKLEEGDVVTLKNVRIRPRDLQGTMSEPKVSKVFEQAGEFNPIVKKFFERRRAFRENKALPELVYSPISDFPVDDHKNCVVEVLAVKTDADPPQFWVTDYSFRSELCETKQNEVWAEGLLGRVLRITLEARQINVAKNLDQRSFISIQDLRLKRTVGVFGGHIGGDGDLIRVVKEDTSDNVAEAIRRLKQRKSLYSVTFCRDLKPVDRKPAVRRMLAKVVDVTPGSMLDFITKHCSKCHNDIPLQRQACVTCNDPHNSAQIQLTCGLRIEDERGDHVDVTVEEDCNLLKNFELQDPNEDKELLARLRSVFDPLVGNLDKENGPVDRNRYAIFEISCWEFEGQISCTVEDIQRP